MTKPQSQDRSHALNQTPEAWGGRATRIEVDLDAIAFNARALRRHAARSILLVVVKADGYGHGACQAGKVALASGAARLAVYTTREGVLLRESGIQAPILVIGPFRAQEAQDLVTHGLTPTVTNQSAAETLQEAAAGRRLRYHLKVDTGLTRSGIALPDAVQFMRHMAEYPALEPEGIFTHFATADETDKTMARRQLKTFLAACEALRLAGFEFPLRHAANSAATLDLSEAHLDMVRCGIAAYGCYPSRFVSHSVPLRPALSLLSSITRVQVACEGTGIGYGHEFRCKRKSTIALVPIGYGDGLPRTLGLNSGRVIIRGQFAPIVGRMSMDQITVDVTGIPGVRTDDRVMLIGSDGGLQQTADDVADRAGTINYEILTGLLPRVPRLYFRGGEFIGYTDMK